MYLFSVAPLSPTLAHTYVIFYQRIQYSMKRQPHTFAFDPLNHAVVNVSVLTRTRHSAIYTTSRTFGITRCLLEYRNSQIINNFKLKRDKGLQPK